MAGISQKNTIAFIGLTFVLVLVPLLFNLDLGDPFNTPRFLALSGFLFIAFAIRSLQKPANITFSGPILILTLAWIATMVIAASYSPNSSEALYILGMRFLAVGLAIWLSGSPNWRQIPLFLAVFGVIELLFGLGEWLNWIDFHAQAEGIVGTVGNPNGFGNLMLLLLPMALWNWKHPNQKIRYFSWLASALIFLGVFAAGSVSALIGLGFLVAALGFWRLFQSKIQRGKSILNWCLTASLLVVIFVPIIWALLNFDKTERVSLSLTNITERALLWRNSAEMIQENPLLGSGLASWKYEILEKGVVAPSTDFGTRMYAEAHNDFLQMFAESGILGGCFYLALCLFLFHCAIRQALNADEKTEQYKAILLASAVAGWCIISSFHFPIERLDHLIVFAAIVALILRKEAKGQSVRPIVGKLFFGAIPLACIFWTVFGWGRMQNEIHLQKLIEAKAEGNWQRVLKEAQLAKGPFCEAEFYSSTPIAWYEGLAAYSTQDLNSALTHFQTSFEQNPFHPHVLNNLASTFVGLNQLDSAKVYYQKSIRIFPEFVDPYLNFAKISAALGDTAGAIQILKQFPDLPKEGKNYSLQLLRELRQ